ncbi:MAG: hypothetical protein M1835_000845 [Candelina submexicana]|nr:MAG: hypothetical protein M1835_000845 [Candelina submexicana]
MACRDCDRRNKSKKDWQATKIAEDIINNGMDGRHNTHTIAHAQPIYAPIPQIYGIDAQQPPYQQPFHQQQTQYQGPEMPKYGTGYMAVPQQAAFHHHPPPPGTVGIEAGRGGNYF